MLLLTAAIALAASAAAGYVAEPVGEWPRPRSPAGLSGLSYAGGDSYFAVDDRGGALHKLQIAIDRDTGAVTNFAIESSVALQGRRDLECVAWDAAAGCVWAGDERDNAICAFDPSSGRKRHTLDTPDVYRAFRLNRGFEALAIHPGGLEMIAANEEALSSAEARFPEIAPRGVDDGPLSSRIRGSLVRIQRYRRENPSAPWKRDGQFAYETDSVGGASKALRAQCGLAEFFFLPDGTPVALEREVSSKGGFIPSFRVRLYEIDLSPAADVSKTRSLAKAGNALPKVAKRRIFGRNTGLAMYEGACAGPVLSDGSQCVVLVSDADLQAASSVMTLRIAPHGAASAGKAESAASGQHAEPVDVSFLMSYRPDHPEDPATKCIVRHVSRHPEIRPRQWGGLTLPGAGGRTQFMLALAGGSAPDIYKAWFHILRHDMEEGFCHPLDEWIKPGTPGEWPGWKAIPELWRKVPEKDGKIYGIAEPGVAYYGIVYRKDIVAAAGMDPENPPSTWDEFAEWCRRLTQPDVAGGRRGRRAFAMENRPWSFLPWVNAAGGDVVSKGEDGRWRASFDSPEAVRAAEFLQSLVAAGVVRALPALSLANETAEMFAQGEIVSIFGGEDFVVHLTEYMNFPPDTIGIMPFPAADASCRPVLQAHRHFYAMTEAVGRRTKRERDAVWSCLEQLVSPDVRDESIRKSVAEGRARWCNPEDLRRLGFGAYLDEMPPGIRKMHEDLKAGRILAATEPYMGFWQAASDLVSRRLLGMLLSDSGPAMDCRAALRSITVDANRGLMFSDDDARIAERRPLARVVCGVLACAVLVCAALVWRTRRRKGGASAPESAGPASRRVLPWLFLAPALALVALWSYWPLLRGALMAFQDYRIIGVSGWSGLDNFIRVSVDPGFWKAWLRTLEYVAVAVALGFTAPVVLALALTEIPRGKVFFRSVYFLPHLTSALVVMLMWKLMYDPTEGGMLNRLLALAGVSRQTWLQDPAWAMVCCILPGVWAGAGISSLMYIAALGSLPPDYYEAAAIDGAGIWGRFRHVTFPQLAPLLVINSVGAFMAAFQGMGSIFLLTFGGPGDATSVLSLVIWKEAYNNLRFSTATTMAWFLGTSLVAFAFLQIRFLRRVEFRRAGG